MPIIRPNLSILETLSNEDEFEFDSENEEEMIEREDSIQNALVNGGISAEKINQNNQSDSSFKKILNHSGASITNASRVIAHVMQNGKYENSKLKAAELVLDLHGIRDKEGRVSRQPIFNFVIKDSSVQMANIFAPVRFAKGDLSENSESFNEGEAL